MKSLKMTLLCIVILTAIMFTACSSGPVRNVTKSQFESVELEVRAAEEKVAQLQAEKDALQAEIDAKQAKRDALQEWADEKK